MEHMNNNSPIDIQKIISTLWAAKMVFAFIVPITFVLAYLITLCIPRYYVCQLELAPEGNNSTGSSLSSLASSFGIGNMGKLLDSEDAISSMLYPDLLKSPNFVITLFPIQVETKDSKIKTDYYTYMSKYQKVPFWDKYIIYPIISLFKNKEEINNKGAQVTTVRKLSKQQQDIINTISGNITCAIDKKTDAIMLTIKDQDPCICATIGDSVMERMQAFIIEYRTKKARNDYKYFKQLKDEAKARYEKSRQLYASMSDSNTDVTLQSVQSKITDLENDMQLQYNTYSSLAAQAQAAQAKIQEKTPAFTPISTAIEPTKPAGPKRLMMSLAITFLITFCTSIYLLIKRE